MTRRTFGTWILAVLLPLATGGVIESRAVAATEADAPGTHHTEWAQMGDGILLSSEVYLRKGGARSAARYSDPQPVQRRGTLGIGPGLEIIGSRLRGR